MSARIYLTKQPKIVGCKRCGRSRPIRKVIWKLSRKDLHPLYRYEPDHGCDCGAKVG